MVDGDREGEIEPVVTEKYEIENGDESKSLLYLDSSENRKSEAWIKTIYYLKKNLLPKIQVFDWDLAGRT